MCLLLREALTVGRIAIAREFFSNELKHCEAKLRIKDELSSYCVVTEPPKTTFGKVGLHLKRPTHARAVLTHTHTPPTPPRALGRFGRPTRASSTASRTTCASPSS